MHETLVDIVLVLGCGTLAQLAAWLLRLPSIVLLLLSGFLLGPVFQVFSVEQLDGNLLFAFISIAVAVILFEGGLGLKFSEISGVRGPVAALVSSGMLITWAAVGVSAYYILKLDAKLSVLLGALLSVSGPTVVLPMLRHLRPRAPLAEILKWEGILIDPIGAMAAVLIFELMMQGQESSTISHLVWGISGVVISGILLGSAGAFAISTALKRHWVPDFLEGSFSLTVVVACHVAANELRPESGLFAVTIMGIIIANGSSAVRHILEFKENLRVLLMSALFILLSARIRLDKLAALDPLACILFLLSVVLIARPLAVFGSTIGSSLNFRQKIFLSALNPRGIVAASVSSLFALELSRAGVKDAELLMPYTFLVIIGTVVLYGFGSGPAGRMLGLLEESREGILLGR